MLRDLQPAVGISIISSIIRIIDEVAGGDREVVHGQAHHVTGVSIDVRALGFGGFTLFQAHGHAFGRGVGPLAVADLILYREAGHGLLAAVIGLGIRIAGDLDIQVRLPHGVEVIIRIRFVRRYLCCDLVFRAARIAVICTVFIPQEVRRSRAHGRGRSRRAGILLVPAFEDEAGTIVGRGNAHLLIDGEGFIRILTGAVPTDIIGICVALIVSDPVDECGSLLILIHVDCSKGNGVLLLGFIGGVAFEAFHRCVSLPDLKRGARIDLFRGAVNMRQQPVGENFVRIRGNRGGTGRGHGQILIIQVIRRRAGTCAGIIFNVDAIRADDLAAPAGIDIQAVVDPCTVHVLIQVLLNIAVQIQLRGTTLVVFTRDIFVREGIRLELELLREPGIHKPADKFIFLTMAVDIIQSFPVVHTEGGALPAQIGVRLRCRNIGMEEDTILGIMPLGIYRQTTLRHGGKDSRLRAGFVQIPAHEGIPDRSGGRI